MLDKHYEVKMFKVPLQNPSPDFGSLERILKGEKKPKKVHFIELGIDMEVIEYIVSNYMNEKWTPPAKENKEGFLKQYINFYYKMGYDFVPIWAEYKNLPQFKNRETADTANLSKGKRSWVEERGGIIKNWDDFEKINWDNIRADLETLYYTQKNLPDGMKITVSGIFFEVILERFFGYEDL